MDKIECQQRLRELLFRAVEVYRAFCPEAGRLSMCWFEGAWSVVGYDGGIETGDGERE